MHRYAYFLMHYKKQTWAITIFDGHSSNKYRDKSSSTASSNTLVSTNQPNLFCFAFPVTSKFKIQYKAISEGKFSKTFSVESPVFKHRKHTSGTTVITYQTRAYTWQTSRRQIARCINIVDLQRAFFPR